MEKENELMNCFEWGMEKLYKEHNNKLTEYERINSGERFIEAYLLSGIIQTKKGEKNNFINDSLETMRKEGFKISDYLSSPLGLLQGYLLYGQSFVMSKPVYDLLKRTSNKTFIRHQPFQTIGIDQRIKTGIEGLEIIFTIFTEGYSEDGSDGCQYLIIGVDERDHTTFWRKDRIGSKNILANSEGFEKGDIARLHKCTEDLYSNFLDYINHPYCKKTIYKLSWNNKKRTERNQLPLRDKTLIELKSGFFDNNSVGEDSKTNNNLSTNKFWVRGHFCHFRNKKRYHMIYELEDKGSIQEWEFFK